MVIKRVNWHGIPLLLGIASELAYLICLGVSFLIPEKYEMIPLLRILLPGFEKTGVGFIIGVVESFIYSYLIGLLLVAVYNWITSRLVPIKFEE